MEEIRFFDMNAVLGGDNRPVLAQCATVEALDEYMASIRLDKALVFHMEGINSPKEGNKLLIQQIAGYERFTGCAVLAPCASGEFGDIGEYFRYLAQNNIKAIRLFPKLHFYTLKTYVLKGVLEQAEKWHMPVIVDFVTDRGLDSIDGTWDVMPDFDSLYTLAKEWPDLNFVLVLPGMTNQRQQYAMLDACSNIYLETSGYSFRFIDNACRRFSAQRLLAGSYIPRVDPAPTMLGVLYADISDEEKRLIAGGNLERLIADAGKEGL